jgi:myo-inositol 2-dehydrogenase / D-chiro-inositol 1-dehydrogenase
MSSKLMIGLTGTSRAGQLHASIIAALPETTLRWVCDPVVEGAKTAAQKHQGSPATTDPTSPGFGDGRATLILADVALSSAAKDGSIDVDPNA